MAERTMFDRIKKQNGEDFAKTIRAYDSSILDIKSLDKILEFAGRGIETAEKLMNYLISLKDIRIEEQAVYQPPIELLSKASYYAFEADTLKKQNSISGLFAKEEALCTFRDPSRFHRFYIIHLIKKELFEASLKKGLITEEDIRRELSNENPTDFITQYANPYAIMRGNPPQREDDYGTSVTSIQISREGGFISIKNRYNHTVDSPDNTFNSNPDNIILGLSNSLRHYTGLDFSSQKVSLPEGFVSIWNQIIKINLEINNIYFGEDFYVKDGQVVKINKDYEIMLDQFILNTKTGEIKDPANTEDSFVEALREELKDKKIQIKKKEDGSRVVLADGIEIVNVKEGNIISVNLPHVKRIGNNFLRYNKSLTEINLLNVQSIGDCFFFSNRALTQIYIPNVQKIGDNFFEKNLDLTKIDLPNVQKIGNNFLHSNTDLTKIDLPNVQNIGDNFLKYNESLTQINLPNVIKIGGSFLYNNETLTQIDLPKVQSVGHWFLYCNRTLTEINFPNIQSIGILFLRSNTVLTKINCPNVTEIGDCFLYSNKCLKEMNINGVQLPAYSLENNPHYSELIKKGDVIGKRKSTLRETIEAHSCSNSYEPTLPRQVSSSPATSAPRKEGRIK